MVGANALKVMGQGAKKAAYAALVYAKIAVPNAAGAADVKHAAAPFARTHGDVDIVFEDKCHAVDGLGAAVVGIGGARHRIQVSQGRLCGLVQPVGRSLKGALGALAVGCIWTRGDGRWLGHSIGDSLRGGSGPGRGVGYGICEEEAFSAAESSPRPRSSLYLDGHFTRMWSATNPSSPA